eukprot:10572747-Prorocentrum_lima.AAC.1
MDSLRGPSGICKAIRTQQQTHKHPIRSALALCPRTTNKEELNYQGPSRSHISVGRSGKMSNHI